MQRRRGLVTQVKPLTPDETLSSMKRDRSLSDSEVSVVSSASSALSSGLSDLEAEVKAKQDQANESVAKPDGALNLDHPDSPRSKRLGTKKGPRPKKDKPDLTDETRFQKMKVKGSEKEILVDMTRVQKYVDLDSAGVKSFQSEVQQAKGNFRQQLADYSDL